MRIENLLKETQELAEFAKDNTIKAIIPKEISNELCETAEVLTIFTQNTNHFKGWFLNDLKFEDCNRKSVCSILNDSKYKKELDLRLKEIRRNKDLGEFLEDLSADKKEIESTINVLLNSISIIAMCLKNKTNYDIAELVLNTFILLERLRELYQLCEKYFQDINGLIEYKLVLTTINGLSSILTRIIKILDNLILI